MLLHLGGTTILRFDDLPAEPKLESVALMYDRRLELVFVFPETTAPSHVFAFKQKLDDININAPRFASVVKTLHKDGQVYIYAYIGMTED